jgi:hypothetical protein
MYIVFYSVSVKIQFTIVIHKAYMGCLGNIIFVNKIILDDIIRCLH